MMYFWNFFTLDIVFFLYWNPHTSSESFISLWSSSFWNLFDIDLTQW